MSTWAGLPMFICIVGLDQGWRHGVLHEDHGMGPVESPHRRSLPFWLPEVLAVADFKPTTALRTKWTITLGLNTVSYDDPKIAYGP